MPDKTVLLVEDHALSRELVSDLLDRCGLHCVVATNAADGLVLAGRECPDLILLDLRLPDRDGLELARILKTTPRTKHIPVIALTACALPGDAERARAAGCDGYWTKPIRTATFLSEIRALLQLPANPAAAPEPGVEPVVLTLVEVPAEESVATPSGQEAAPVLTLVEVASDSDGSFDEAPIAPAESRRSRKPLPFVTTTEAAAQILVVDDDAANREMLGAMLRSIGYRTVFAASGSDALAQLETPFDLIILDYRMPGQNGPDVCRRIRDDGRYAEIPVLMVTALTGSEERSVAFDAGINDWLSKPFDTTDLALRVGLLLKLRQAQLANEHHQRSLEETLRARTIERKKAIEEVHRARAEAHRTASDALQRMAHLAELREGLTAAAHLRAVGNYSAELARELGFSGDLAHDLLLASQVHDIGLLVIEETIALSTEPRTELEEARYRQHPLLGARLLSSSSAALFHLAETIALTHHERWDGQGYPQGLRGEAIPLTGRIVAVADQFDRWTAYAPGWTPLSNDEACQRLQDEAGAMFDPKVVAAFFTRLDAILEIQQQFRRTEMPPSDLPLTAVYAN